jgi:hypothetical protein
MKNGHNVVDLCISAAIFEQGGGYAAPCRLIEQLVDKRTKVELSVQSVTRPAHVYMRQAIKVYHGPIERSAAILGLVSTRRTSA